MTVSYFFSTPQKKRKKYLYLPVVNFTALTPVKGAYKEKKTKNGTLFIQEMLDEKGDTVFSYGLLKKKTLVPVSCNRINKAFNVDLTPVSHDSIIHSEVSPYFIALSKPQLNLPGLLGYQYGCEIYLKDEIPDDPGFHVTIDGVFFSF
jgi:hypothetical protein